ncbi:hypothetical protein ACHWQZ_G014203 [Mnemiopsis leidyi]
MSCTSQQIRWASAVIFYMMTSFAIVAANKSVLSIYKFPSVQFVTLVQLIATVFVLEILKSLKFIDYPGLSISSFKNVMPLPLLHLANLMVGLGSTKMLRKKFDISIVLTVLAMLGGVIVAFIGDLAYDSKGYTLVLLNNLFTAAYSICLKKVDDKKLMGKVGLIYYNSIISLPIALVSFILSGDFATVRLFTGWSNWQFCVQFALINILGFLLTYSTILCNNVCGPLTQNVAGVLKSTAITYAGMWFGGDYIFSWLNFTGITISAVGGIVYSGLTFSRLEREKRSRKSDLYVA